METKPNPEQEYNKVEKVVETVFCIVLGLSALIALYSLIWANRPVFKLSLTVFVTVIIGIAFDYFIANHFDRIFKRK